MSENKSQVSIAEIVNRKDLVNLLEKADRVLGYIFDDSEWENFRDTVRENCPNNLTEKEQEILFGSHSDEQEELLLHIALTIDEIGETHIWGVGQRLQKLINDLRKDNNIPLEKTQEEEWNPDDEEG